MAGSPGLEPTKAEKFLGFPETPGPTICQGDQSRPKHKESDP